MSRLSQRIRTILYYAFRICPVKNNKIVVSSYMGRGFGGEGKLIIDKLTTQNNSYDIVWLVNDCKETPQEGIRYVKENSIRAIYEMVTAKIWIDNRRKSGCVRKRSSQYYIQTWHGDVCIKKVEKDAGSGLSQEYVNSAIRDSKMADLFISGSEWRTKNYRDAFWYEGEILKGNLYKTFSEGDGGRRKIWDRFNLQPNVKYALYAPTFRNDHRLECYSLDYTRLVKSLERKFGGKWCVILRLHPNIADLHTQIKYDNTVLNGSSYEQINDLINNCDLLISDYSGVIFDGFRSKKRVVLYASDFEKYTQEERDLYFDLKTLPSPIVQNNDELEDIINCFDDCSYNLQRIQFVEELGCYLVDAAQMVAERIKNITSGGTK